MSASTQSLFNEGNTTSNSLNKKGFEPALHLFRGFAILSVVTIHVFGFVLYFTKFNNTGFDVDFLFYINEVLFHDATIYFTLISGILFSFVLEKKGWRHFFKSKFLHVFLPYFFFTCYFTYSHYTFGGHRYYRGDFIGYLKSLGISLLKGDGLPFLWYIPVLLVLYIFTPLIVYLLKNNKLSWLALIIAILPLVSSRVWPEPSIYTFLYFTGVYTIGLFVGYQYEVIIEKIKHNIWLLVLIGVLTTVGLWFLVSKSTPKWGIISFQETLFFIQKLSFSALAIYFFKIYAAKIPSWLTKLSDYSFPIYFFHGYLLLEFHFVLVKWIVKMSGYTQVALVAISALLIMLVACMAMALLFKLIFRRWSKFLIGY